MTAIRRKRYFRFVFDGRYRWLTGVIGLLLQPTAMASLPIEGQANQWVVQQIQQIGQQQDWQSLDIKPNLTLFNQHDRAVSCSTPLQFSAPLLRQSPTRFPLVIRCANPAWVIRAQAQVAISLTAVVATKPLSAGTLLTAEDITLAQTSLPSGRRMDLVTQPSDALQMTLKREIAQGQPLVVAWLNTPRLITRHQPITLVIEQEGLTLSTSGIALQSGGKGDTLRVKNSRSGRILSGTVIDAQQVMIHSVE